MSNRKKKPSPRLSRDQVLQAAVSFADQNDLKALSMRKLAESLGVEAMSLYNHIKNKEDLYDGLVEIVVAKIDAPTVGDNWKGAMRQRAISAHEVLLNHPWAAKLMVSRANVGPAMLHYVDATIGCLLSAGFSYEMADRAWNAIDSHVYGFTLLELNFPFEQSEYSEVAESFMPQIPEDEYPYLHGMSQQVIDGSHDGVQDFNFGLDLVLDGLERMLISQSE